MTMQPGLTKLTGMTPFICSRSLRHVRLMSSTTLNVKNKSGNTHGEMTTSNPPTEKWSLYAGLCLERRPIISKQLTPFEKKFSAYVAQFEYEMSHKSDHEIRHESDKTLMEKMKRGEVEQANIQTAQDYEDQSVAELKSFTPAPRNNEADAKKNLQSLERSLDSHLLFAIKQKLGDNYLWILPHLKREEGENMRQVAERILTTYCPTVNARILGNAPWGFYKYKLPKGTKDESGEELTGAKIFFYKAQFLSGEVKLEREDSKRLSIFTHAWLKRSELSSHFQQPYLNAISGFLIPEY